METVASASPIADVSETMTSYHVRRNQRIQPMIRIMGAANNNRMSRTSIGNCRFATIAGNRS